MPSIATTAIKSLKQVFSCRAFGPRSVFAKSDSDTESGSSFGSNHRIPSGYIAVDVGSNRDLFVIPIRLLNLPFFAALLQRSADQFGYPVDGPLILPCDAHFLDRVLNLLKKDEDRFGKFGPDEFDRFLNLFDKAGIDSTDKNKKEKKWRKPTFF
ncbi:hypothetical protein Scep_023140 [Stephania cephalantha]|uniref:Uncharacterized protein n=1 Tax=Stephania cephalantha TaxID=152367 RepID=A0AAP0EWX2_9MAGN